MSLSLPPFSVRWKRLDAASPEALDQVGAARDVDRQRVVGRLGAQDVERHAGVRTETDPALPERFMTSTPTVPFTVSASAAPSPSPLTPRSMLTNAISVRQVIHRRRVRAAERVQVERLDVVGVHDDVPDVAREEQPSAVRRGREDLRARRAVEVERVATVLALDDVAAVAGIPDEGVVVLAPRNAVSLPPLPSTPSAPSPPMSVSAPLPPFSVSLPSPPSRVSCINDASAPPESVSPPPSPRTVSRSFAASGFVTST